MKGLLFSHPTGNANVRAVLAGLLDAGILGEFHTTIASYPGSVWDYFGNSRWGRDLKRRSYDERLRRLTLQHPYRELGRMLTNRLKLDQLGRHETGVFCIDAVYQGLDRVAATRLRKNPAAYSGVYTYEDGALETFKAAADLNIRRIYDLPIAYWQTLRQLLAEEAGRLPAWKETLAGGVADSERKLERKTRELEWPKSSCAQASLWRAQSRRTRASIRELSWPRSVPRRLRLPMTGLRPAAKNCAFFSPAQ